MRAQIRPVYFHVAALQDVVEKIHGLGAWKFKKVGLPYSCHPYHGLDATTDFRGLYRIKIRVMNFQPTLLPIDFSGKE